MNKLFQIGTFCFQIICPDEVPFPTNFLLFEIIDGIPEYTYQFHITDTLPVPKGEIIAQRPDLTVFNTFIGECRLIGIKGHNTYYAFYKEISEFQSEIYLAIQEIAELNIDPVFTSLFSLERQIIKKDSLILHCAYVKYQNKAILFSAPSRTGKTTQANLWERYRGSYTVNGDRALLRKTYNQWIACGWPVCGSSNVCHLGETPIHSIVMLKQGEENQVVQLSPLQAFAQLYSQITINQWNLEFVNYAIHLIEDLTKQIPVYQLTCNMTEDAVKCLDNMLFLYNE